MVWRQPVTIQERVYQTLAARNIRPSAHLLHDMGHYGEAQALSQNPAENPLQQALRRARDDAEEVAVRNGMHPDVLAYIRAQKFTGPEGVA